MPQLKPELEFEAIGTRWFIELESALSSELEDAIMTRIEQFDLNYSRFRSNSLITTMARSAGAYHLPPDAGPMLDLYQSLYHLTNGAMTPLIGQVLSDAGYDASYSLTPKQLTSPPTWDEILLYEPASLTLRQPALLDFGAMGKGYLVDIVSQLLMDHGHTTSLVNAGGDMYYRGAGTIEIGLEDPTHLGTIVGVAALGEGMALCGSSGNRRSWAGYTHVIDPYLLSSPDDVLATWVVARVTILADALTTALSFTSAEKLHQDYEFEYAKILADGTIERSPNFPGRFLTMTQQGTL